MINKRLLIKNLLAHNDENSFYDKKRQIDISQKEGKGKFLKHICALSNSNPKNNSYIVIGVEDEDNELVGVDFFDDSKIQNLINAYLTSPPIVQYENIPFPNLQDHKVIGLVTIRHRGKVTSLRKNIWKYQKHTVFVRDGSISKSITTTDFNLRDYNSRIVNAIEAHSNNNIEHTLNGVFDFLKKRHDISPTYKVFKEYFVLCWAGQKKTIKGENYYSRVDIELINEQVRLFYSALDDVTIYFDDNSFKIIEYVSLKLQDKVKYYPLEETIIYFKDNINYTIATTLLFKPPKFDKNLLLETYKSSCQILEKLKTSLNLSSIEDELLDTLPDTFLICYLNNIDEAIEKLYDLKPYIKQHQNSYIKYKEVLRILRKIKYN